MKSRILDTTASGLYWTATGRRLRPNPIRVGGITQDFQSWLEKNGYGDRAEHHSRTKSFGGREAASETLQREPVVVVNGNSDDGAGWRNLVLKMLEEGYRSSEIYVFSYGPGSLTKGTDQTHDEQTVRDVRRDMESVLAYTGAKKLRVVGHSLGCTLSAGAIDGVAVREDKSHVKLGEKLPVDTWVAIAGDFDGNPLAYLKPDAPALNDSQGFHPDSEYLRLVREAGKRADRVYTITSLADGVAGVGAAAVRSGQVETQDGGYVSASLDHMALRDLHGGTVLRMLEGDFPNRVVGPNVVADKWAGVADRANGVADAVQTIAEKVAGNEEGTEEEA